MLSHEVLFTLDRGGYTEVSVSGEIAVWDGHSLIYRTGEISGSYPARSLLKPFQWVACKIPEDRWGKISDKSHYTTALGSITATPEQVSFLQERLGEKPSHDDLVLPAVYPADESHRSQLRKEGVAKQKIYNACFSKHCCILESCEIHGWEKKAYNSKQHPFHSALVGVLSGLLGSEPQHWVTDGCGLPTPVLGLGQLARLYQRLANAAAEQPLGRACNMMRNQPNWIGGPGRIDTNLIQENEPHLVAKVGADGLVAIGIRPSQNFPQGLGVALKLDSDVHWEWAGLALVPLLERLGLHSVAKVPEGQKVNYHYLPFEKRGNQTVDISPIIDESLAVWPGDVPFERSVSLDMANGGHLTLSSIRSTLHLGAHTDGPNHYNKEGVGIGEVDISKYLGICQVISVKKERGTLIEPEDLTPIAIEAPRILIRTLSFPDPKKFNEDFVALSSAAIQYLDQLGVVLVGVDTPSIDPFDSKDLPAHMATLPGEMAILEGITLSNVKPGIYELICTPLRLPLCDASPVRALLRTI